MANEMKKQNRYNVQPIIAIEPAHNPFKIEKSDGKDILEILQTKFKNVGVGPALNVSFHLYYPGHSFEPYLLKIFEKGSERSYDFGTPFTRSSNPNQNSETTIIVRYTDIFKNPQWSKISFAIDEQRKAITSIGALEIGEGVIES